MWDRIGQEESWGWEGSWETGLGIWAQLGQPRATEGVALWWSTFRVGSDGSSILSPSVLLWPTGLGWRLGGRRNCGKPSWGPPSAFGPALAQSWYY